MANLELIKKLRDRTGVGIGKCKDALEKANGDLDQAIEILRKAGIASAVNKAERSTEEGLIVSAQHGNTIALVEVNAETDFVTKNPRFQEFAQNIAEEAALLAPNSLETFLSSPYSKGKNQTIDEYRTEQVQAIGENIQVSRILILKEDNLSSIGLYSHMGGQVVSIVKIQGSDSQKELARSIAMHVAATSPEFLSADDIPLDILEKEKEIAAQQVQGKPDNIIDKIVEGKVKAFCKEACLNTQDFIKDNSISVENLVKKAGNNLYIERFIRWAVGQK